MADPADRDEGVGAAIIQVVDDAKAYASAQVALYREMLAARWRVAQAGLILGAVAAVLALAALIALLVGLIIALTPLIGALGATALVVLAALAIAGLLAWFAASRLSAAMGPIE